MSSYVYLRYITSKRLKTTSTSCSFNFSDLKCIVGWTSCTTTKQMDDLTLLTNAKLFLWRSRFIRQKQCSFQWDSSETDNKKLKYRVRRWAGMLEEIGDYVVRGICEHAPTDDPLKQIWWPIEKRCRDQQHLIHEKELFMRLWTRCGDRTGQGRTWRLLEFSWWCFWLCKKGVPCQNLSKQ